MVRPWSHLSVLTRLLEPLLFVHSPSSGAFASSVVRAWAWCLSHVLPALVSFGSSVCVVHLAVQPFCAGALGAHVKAVLPLRSFAGAPLSVWSIRGLADRTTAVEALSLRKESSLLWALRGAEGRTAVVSARSWGGKFLLTADEAFAGESVVLLGLHRASEPS